MIKVSKLILAAAALTASLSAAALSAGPAVAEVTALVGGRVVTNGPAGVIEDGAVVFEDAQLTYVGPAASATFPAGATVVDAQGLWVTPGLFAPITRLGLIEVSAEDDTNDAGASASEFSVALDAADGFNPAASAIAITRIEGVTRAAVTPAPSSNLFAGQGALINLSGAPDSLTRPRAFAHAAFGESGAALSGGSRLASWAFFRAALKDARGYPARFMAHKEGDAIDRYDAEALGPYARGAAPILVALDRASDLRNLAAFAAQEPAMRFIVVGGAEAHLAADELANANIPVILDPVRNLPSSFAAVGASFDTAQILEAAGVTYAFSPITTNGGNNHNARLLAQAAGNAVAYGLSWDDAFDAITGAPARIYGVDDELGSLEIGKRADVVLWNGDPLEVMSAPVGVYIDGAETDLTSRQTKLRDRYLVLTRETGLTTAYPRP